jgi:hypothetical protein
MRTHLVEKMDKKHTFQAYKTINRPVYAIWHDKKNNELVYSESEDNGRSWDQELAIVKFNPAGEVYLDVDEFQNVYILFYGYQDIHLAVKQKQKGVFELKSVPGAKISSGSQKEE